MLKTRGVSLLAVSSVFMVGGCSEWNGRVSANAGHTAYLEKDFVKAIASYEEALNYLPKNKTIIRNLGYALLSRSREEIPREESLEKSNKAIDMLAVFLEEDPGNTELASLLLDAWEQADRLSDAAKYFKSRLDKNPNDLQSLKGLGIVELKRGNYRGAIELYEKRKNVDQEDVQIYVLIAQTTWQWLRAGGPNDLQEAIDLASKGIEAAMEGARRQPEDTNPLVFARLLLFQKLALQKDDPVEVEKARLEIEVVNKRIGDLNKKAEALLQEGNVPKAGEDEKQ